MSRNRMIHRPSFCYILGFSAWAITRRISLPLDVSKPVFIAKPMQHFTGGLGIDTSTLVAVINCLISYSLYSSFICSISVPQNKILPFWYPSWNFLPASAAAMASLIWGTASPVKMASLTTQLPPNNKMSQGTFLYDVFSSYFLGALGLVSLPAKLEKKGMACFKKSLSLIISNLDFLCWYPGWIAMMSPGKMS